MPGDKLVLPHRNRVSRNDVCSSFVIPEPLLQPAHCGFVLAEYVVVFWLFIVPQRVDAAAGEVKVISIKRITKQRFQLVESS